MTKARRIVAKTAVKLCVIGAVVATVAIADKVQYRIDQEEY